MPDTVTSSSSDMLKKALNTLHRGYQVNQGSGTKSNSIILFLQQSAQTVIQSTAKDECLYFLQRERAMSGEKHFVQRAVVFAVSEMES